MANSKNVPLTDNNDNDINEKIAWTKAQIHRMKQQREEDRRIFTDNLVNLAQRHHFCHHELSRQHSSYKASLLPQAYIHAIQKLSDLGESRYVLTNEANLCHTFHLLEIQLKHLELLTKQREQTIDEMKRKKQEETKLKEVIEAALMRDIKFVSIDMTGIIVENDNILDQQKHQISHLKGETSNTEDVKSSLPINNISSPPSVTQVSLKQNASANHQTMNREERITKVGSYFGIYQTAQAA